MPQRHALPSLLARDRRPRYRILLLFAVGLIIAGGISMAQSVSGTLQADVDTAGGWTGPSDEANTCSAVSLVLSEVEFDPVRVGRGWTPPGPDPPDLLGGPEESAYGPAGSKRLPIDPDWGPRADIPLYSRRVWDNGNETVHQAARTLNNAPAVTVELSPAPAPPTPDGGTEYWASVLEEDRAPWLKSRSEIQAADEVSIRSAEEDPNEFSFYIYLDEGVAYTPEPGQWALFSQVGQERCPKGGTGAGQPILAFYFTPRCPGAGAVADAGADSGDGDDTGDGAVGACCPTDEEGVCYHVVIRWTIVPGSGDPGQDTVARGVLPRAEWTRIDIELTTAYSAHFEEEKPTACEGTDPDEAAFQITDLTITQTDPWGGETTVVSGYTAAKFGRAIDALADTMRFRVGLYRGYRNCLRAGVPRGGARSGAALDLWDAQHAYLDVIHFAYEETP